MMRTCHHHADWQDQTAARFRFSAASAAGNVLYSGLHQDEGCALTNLPRPARWYPQGDAASSATKGRSRAALLGANRWRDFLCRESRSKRGELPITASFQIRTRATAAVGISSPART